MTQQVSFAIGPAAPPPAWSITVIADLYVKPSVANPDLWSVTVPALASWSVVYSETLDGFATEAEATTAGLATAESQGWAEYPPDQTGKLQFEGDESSAIKADGAQESAISSKATRHKA
jgi:hypothetical protein